MNISPQEMARLQKYMQGKFANKNISVRGRSQAPDSVEVLLDGEFIGIIYKDDEDADDVSYDFNMAILNIDLESAA